MEKLTFASDYMEGAHPQILKRLAEINFEKNPGYGLDKYCDSAREKIKRACHCPQAAVFFLEGGTQTNATVIDALLRQYQGVVAAVSGHVNGHEAGAVEAGGHKVLALAGADGKLSAEQVQEYLQIWSLDGNREHMVEPGAVYISHPTEYGTLYTKRELSALHRVCKEFHIPLFLDGARLGYGLAAEGTDVALTDIAANTDVFYIGGTKVGALFGEAVVFPRPELAEHFFTITKQHGGLLAKGWLLGIQFEALFTDDLYMQGSRHAISMAMKMKRLFMDRGYTFKIDSATNQQFVILENEELKSLSEHVEFSFWEREDEKHTVVRFATSWATREEDIDRLGEYLSD